MEVILRIFLILGINTIFITPLTLVLGIINAIKKPKEEAKKYTIMAVVSAYLIIIPIMAILFKI